MDGDFCCVGDDCESDAVADESVCVVDDAFNRSGITTTSSTSTPADGDFVTSAAVDATPFNSLPFLSNSVFIFLFSSCSAVIDFFNSCISLSDNDLCAPCNSLLLLSNDSISVVTIIAVLLFSEVCSLLFINL